MNNAQPQVSSFSSFHSLFFESYLFGKEEVPCRHYRGHLRSSCDTLERTDIRNIMFYSSKPWDNFFNRNSFVRASKTPKIFFHELLPRKKIQVPK